MDLKRDASFRPPPSHTGDSPLPLTHWKDGAPRDELQRLVRCDREGTVQVVESARLSLPAGGLRPGEIRLPAMRMKFLQLPLMGFLALLLGWSAGHTQFRGVPPRRGGTPDAGGGEGLAHPAQQLQGATLPRQSL